MSDIVSRIKNKLVEIESEKDVKLILAIESGSRAWGFASPDSDYDVRFIYARNVEDYVCLKPKRDVIEWQLDDVYDVSGWDLQKALKLMYDSNPVLHEWCNSPIVYRESDLADTLRELAAKCFVPKKALYHYVSMARTNYSKYLDNEEVRLKKYFYGLRPILAARWVAEYKTAPPMLFTDLVSAELPAELVPVVDDLLRKKMETPEIGTGPQIREINSFISEQIELMHAAAEQEDYKKNDLAELEEFFRDAVMGTRQEQKGVKK